VVGWLDISHYQSCEGDSRVRFDVWADAVINLATRPSDGESEREFVPAGGRGDAREDPDDLPF
jgi:hypothetical protein